MIKHQVTHLPMPNIKKISCGPNHTVAVDENNKVDTKVQSVNFKPNTVPHLQAFSWGFGGYGRLGHSETADELVRRCLLIILDGIFVWFCDTDDFERCHG